MSPRWVEPVLSAKVHD
jgi:hypothetical protein